MYYKYYILVLDAKDKNGQQNRTRKEKGSEKMRMTKDLKKKMTLVLEAACSSMHGEGIWCDIEEDYIYPDWANEVIIEMYKRLKIW